MKTEIWAPSEHKETRRFKPSAQIGSSGDVTESQIPLT